VNDLVNAEKFYTEAVNMGSIPTDHYFYFSQTLKQAGKYAESDKWMNTFYEKSNSDKRAISFANNRSYLEKIAEDIVQLRDYSQHISKKLDELTNELLAKNTKLQAALDVAKKELACVYAPHKHTDPFYCKECYALFKIEELLK
jgi:hypothetical protein